MAFLLVPGSGASIVLPPVLFALLPMGSPLRLLAPLMATASLLDWAAPISACAEWLRDAGTAPAPAETATF